MADQVVLLSAAVRPTTTVHTKIVDPSSRKNQYRSAISCWREVARNLGVRIVVVEMSGAESSDLFEAPVDDRITYISLIPPAELNDRGKGALEAFGIDHAVARMLDTHDPEATVHKVTGRLSIANASSVIRALRPSTVRVRRTLDRRYVDSRLISASLQDWSSAFRAMSEEIRDGEGRYLEHVFAARLIRLEYERKVKVEPFAQRPLFRGLSGSTGDRYGGSLRAVSSMMLGPVERALLSKLSKKQV